ncbi:MAG: multiubiquitin domain-containing protein [Chitinophagaceae bacterium]
MLKDDLNKDQKGHGEGHHDHVLPLLIEGKEYKWPQQYITGAEIRKLGNIPPGSKILLAIKRPWEDEVIEDETKVDLARPGIEHFFVRKPDEGVLVEIFINDKKYEVKRGKYTVAELKTIGGVPQADELEELVDGKLTPLKDNVAVLIKGCEQFFSHKRDGTSS